MTDFDLVPFGRLVGGRVKTLREDRGWTQKDLAGALSKVSSRWTRATVGQLETDGVRGERVMDLAALCIALDVSLAELLGGGDGAVGAGGQGLALVRAALAGPETPRPARTTAIDPLLIGSQDEEAEVRMARRLGVNRAVLREQVAMIFDCAEPSLVRDAIAGITPSTTKREAQAKRGRATLRLLRALETGASEPSDVERVLQALANYPVFTYSGEDQHGNGE